MYRFFISFSLCCVLFKSVAGVPALEREVNMVLTNEPAGNVLRKIQDQTGLIFSYSSSVLNRISPVSISLKQKTVREALALILPKDVMYKTKNNYIILKEKTVEKETKKKELSGYIYDKNTEKKLANVTVYDKTSLQSVNSDDYGFYKITVPKEKESISVNKTNYKDTVIALTDVQDNAITNIALNPINDTIKKQDSLGWKAKLHDFSDYTLRMFRNFKGYITTLNITDTLTKPFQLSLFPFVGTNHKLSANVVNRVSVNIFGGYARGVEGVEAGGFFNVDKANMKGVQMAGFFNMVGDSVRGTQLAGFFNVTGKNMQGFQGAGFFNANLGEVDGLGAAGFMNVNRHKTSGLQFAGFVNVVSDSLTGLQGAGFMNTAGHTKGMQVSGFFNHARSIHGAQFTGFLNHSSESAKGIQASGFMNLADSTEGAQVTGFLNHSRYIKGVQVTGFLNHAKMVDGYQVGIINISDSCKGLPIGLFNFVKHGLHQLELSADELFYTNLSFRTGVPAFYSVFSAGIGSASGAETKWTFGYALGTSFKIRNKLRSDITLGTQHINITNFTEGNSDLYKLYWGVEYKFNSKISVAAGPTFNLFLSDTTLPGYKSDIAPYSFFDNTYANGLNLKGWVGGKIAIRFF